MKRLDDAAFYLEQMQRMTAERAALERKFAKDLTKFSAKWEERMGKVCVRGPRLCVRIANLHVGFVCCLHFAELSLCFGRAQLRL